MSLSTPSHQNFDKKLWLLLKCLGVGGKEFGLVSRHGELSMLTLLPPPTIKGIGHWDGAMAAFPAFFNEDRDDELWAVIRSK